MQNDAIVRQDVIVGAPCECQSINRCTQLINQKVLVSTATEDQLADRPEIDQLINSVIAVETQFIDIDSRQSQDVVVRTARERDMVRSGFGGQSIVASTARDP